MESKENIQSMNKATISNFSRFMIGIVHCFSSFSWFKIAITFQTKRANADTISLIALYLAKDHDEFTICK